MPRQYTLSHTANTYLTVIQASEAHGTTQPTT
jgi:hypothetical protein